MRRAGGGGVHAVHVRLNLVTYMYIPEAGPVLLRRESAVFGRPRPVLYSFALSWSCRDGVHQGTSGPGSGRGREKIVK